MDLLKAFRFNAGDEEEEDGPMELKRVRVREVSLCTRAANRRTFLLYKSADNDEHRGGDTKMANSESVEDELAFRKAMRGEDAAFILTKAIEDGYNTGAIAPGDGQTAGAISKAMDAGASAEACLDISPLARDLHRRDTLAGRNTYVQQAAVAAVEAQKSRVAKADADPGPGAELMRRAKALVVKSAGKLDVADAITKIRQDDPDLRERADREAAGV